MSQYRVYGVSMINLEHRFNYASRATGRTSSTTGTAAATTIRLLAVHRPRPGHVDAEQRGASAFGIYPLNRYQRIEFSSGFGYIREQYNDPSSRSSRTSTSRSLRQLAVSQRLVRAFSVSFVQETTIFREFGPLSGSTMRLMYEVAPDSGGNMLSWQTVDADVRKYFKVGSSALLALRARASAAGRHAVVHLLRRQLGPPRLRLPRVRWPERRLRQRRVPLPLVNAMATPIGILGASAGWRSSASAGRGGTTPATSSPPAPTRSSRPSSASISTSDGGPKLHLRRPGGDYRVPPGGRARLVRGRPRDDGPRVPDSLRLVLEDAVQRDWEDATSAARSTPRRGARPASSSGSASTSRRPPRAAG